MKHFADGIDTGRSSERRPKVFPDVFDSVDTKTIDTVILHQRFNPADERSRDPWVLRIDIRQNKRVVTQPTLFDVRLIVVVRNQTPGMEIAGLVERVERSKGGRRVGGSEVVDYNINHEVHISSVQGVGKRNQVASRAKVRIDFVDVLCPVAVVSFSVSGRTLDIGNNR